MSPSLGKLRSSPRPLRRLTISTAALIALVLAMDVALIVHLRESELLTEENHLKSLSLTLAEQTERSFEAVDLVLSSFADYMADRGIMDRTALDREMATRDVHLLLKQKISGIPQADAVTVINADGKLINFTRYWPIPEVNVSDRDYFQALSADPTRKIFISVPVQNRGTGTWTIYLARRLNGKAGEFLGLVLGAMELKYFEDFYRAVSPGEESSIVLIRQDGVMLARYPPAVGVGNAFGAQRILQGGIAGTVREPSPIDGLFRIKAAHALAKYPLFVLTTTTEAAALNNWRNIARLMSMAAIASAISIAVAGFALGRHWRQQTILAQARADMADAARARLVAEAELRRQKDVTAAFEAMRLAKEEADIANRAKSEFLATMSHELRTPLNAIMGFSEMMMKEALGPLGDARYRVYAKDIHASGRHLLDIINDILDLSKAVAGKLDLAESWIEVSDAVASVCRLIGPRISEAGLSLSTTTPDGLVILGDERKLKQMLLNLLSNACKFTPPGGRIECTVAVEASGIVLAVSDTGIGIPADQLNRVLLPFVQVESSLSRLSDGTGLGLPIVKAMAELHGGSLHLGSVPGAGTTATVTLPLERLMPARVLAGEDRQDCRDPCPSDVGGNGSADLPSVRVGGIL